MRTRNVDKNFWKRCQIKDDTPCASLLGTTCLHLLLNLTKLLSNKKILSQDERDEKVSIFCFSLRAVMKIVESVFKLEKLFPDVQRLTFFLCLNYEEKFLKNS